MTGPQVTTRARPNRVANDALRQHVELAAFLWAQRDTLLNADPPDVQVAKSIGERLDVHLDALRIAGAAAWPFAIEQWADFPDKGELFACVWLAIELEDEKGLNESIEFFRAERSAAYGFVGALEIHRADKIARWVRQWVPHEDTVRRQLAAHAIDVHKMDPGKTLLYLLKDSGAETRSIGLRLTARFRRIELVEVVAALLDDRDAQVRFWAGIALAELGFGERARPDLEAVAASDDANALTALRTLIKTTQPQEVRSWLGGLMRAENPMAVRAVGMLNDKTYLNWLVDRMREPAMAIAAGAAFLELFPDAAQEDDLFTIDPAEAGLEFVHRFEYGDQRIPLADRVMEWAKAAGFVE